MQREQIDAREPWTLKQAIEDHWREQGGAQPLVTLVDGPEGAQTAVQSNLINGLVPTPALRKQWDDERRQRALRRQIRDDVRGVRSPRSR